MGKIQVFNSISLDGYFTGEDGDLNWAHENADDAEWNEFVAGNASQGEGALLMGRVTYDMMESFWPTPEAKQSMPDVAEGMSRMQKYVFSRTRTRSDWENTTFLSGDPAAETARIKTGGPGITILGSGSIIAQLAGAGLIDEYTIVVVPAVLGKGRTMFEGVRSAPRLKLANTRTFRNGRVVLTYEN